MEGFKLDKKKLKQKVKKVLGEFSRGELKSGSGAPVKKKSQALAIGYSEAGKARNK